jgi:UBX domain-containing protein 1/4
MSGQVPTAGGQAAAAPPASASSGVAGKDFKETRLQIRLSTGGQPLVTTLNSDARMCSSVSKLVIG